MQHASDAQIMICILIIKTDTFPFIFINFAP